MSKRTLTAEERDVRLSDAMAEMCSMIVDRIARDGLLPWSREWIQLGGGGVPVNAQTGNEYNGFNRIFLGMFGVKHWAGFGQWKKLGARVIKGSTHTKILRPVFGHGNDKSTGDKYQYVRGFAVAQVFGSHQVTGWDAPEVEAAPELTAPEACDAADAIVRNMPNAPSITWAQQDGAFYMPSHDSVTMPTREQFETTEGMYKVLFHELAHSTGHESRLARRDGMKIMARHSYSREELVAEFGAAMLADAAGLKIDVDNSASYIKTWLDRIAREPKILIDASKDAQKAVRYVLGQTAHKAVNTPAA